MGIGTKGPSCSTGVGWVISTEEEDMVVVDSVAVGIVSWEDDSSARGSFSSTDVFGADVELSFASTKGVGGFGFSFFFSFFDSFGLGSTGNTFVGSSLDITGS